MMKPIAPTHLSRVALLFVCLGMLLGLSARQAHASCTSGSWIAIHAIQTSLPDSPCLGTTVTTSGVVTAVLSDGFYIESAGSALNSYAESWDSDTCTSEGIFVYTPNNTASSLVALKQHVLVVGPVNKSNSSERAGTQIEIDAPVIGTNITIVSSSNSLPSAVSASVVTSAINNGGCSSYSANSFGQWLPFEGMRINVPSSATMLVTEGTGGTVTPASQSATSNGQFWGLITSTTRTFRATGINVLDPAYIANESALTTQGVTVWNGNPTLLLIDSTTLGGSALNASAGTKYTGSSNLIGIVDYHISTQGYTGLLLESSAVSSLSSVTGNQPTAASARLSSVQVTFATLDLNGLLATETNRITKLTNAIVNYMQAPDVLAVQGTTSDALNLLASAVSSASGSSYVVSGLSTTTAGCTSDCLYNAFLINPAKLDGTPIATQALATTTWTNSTSVVAPLFERSPLVLAVKIPRKGISDFTLYVVNASLLDRAVLTASATSTDARTQRELQAELLATQVLEPYETSSTHVMLMGGLNSFEFSDGYVDTLGILDGSEAANVTASTVWLYDATYNSSTLVNSTTDATNLSLSKTNPATSRYTYVESGSAEQPDHILYTSDLSSLVSIDYARVGADFPVVDTYDTSTVARATTHDGLIAYLTVPYPTTTTLTSTPNPSYYEQTVTFTATVAVKDDTTGLAGTPDGTVTFYDGSTKIGTGSLSSGVATFQTSLLTVGTHSITASYAGSESNLGYQSSTSAVLSQVVNKDVTSLVLDTSVNPSYYGQPVTFTATATSSGVTPSGSIVFTDTTNATVLCAAAAMSGGVATCATSTLSVGSHAIVATYVGDTTNTSATSNTIAQLVNTNTTTLSVVTSLTPSYSGQPVTFTATLVGSYGTPTGTITFTDGVGGTTLATGTLNTATGTYTATATSGAITTLSVGTHTIQAVYAGDGTNAAATGSVTQVVQANTTTVSVNSSLNPSYYGDSVIFTATTVGSYGTPTGTVTFTDSSTGTTLGTITLAAGTAQYTATASTAAITTLSVGTHAIVATYNSDGTHATGSGTVSQVVKSNASTLLLTASASSIYLGHSVSFPLTATAVSGVPTGSVSYMVDGVTTASAALAAGTSASSTSWSTSALTVGTHTITAYYAGDGTHDASTSNSVTVTVLATYATTSTLVCSPTVTVVGNSINCTDSITASTGQVAGTITYYDGTTALGTATVTNGVASFTLPGLAVGVHTVYAIFAENDPYLASTSNTQSITIISDYKITIAPTAQTFYTGEAATYTVTVTPGTNFTLDVALACSGVPANTTCTLTPATVSGGSGSSQLVIQTTAPQQTTSTAKLERGGGLMLAGLFLFLLPRRLRKRAAWLALLFVALTLGTLTACGGSGTLTGGTTAGSYTITVSGTAAVGSVSIPESATTTLTVKSMF